MGKKTTKETKAEESQTQSGILTTLFSGDMAEAGESSGFSSLFSDDNPFRRKKADPKPAETHEPNIDNNEEEETVSLVKTKKSKKGKTLVSDSDGEDVVESGLESKKKKRKRDEIESEYETKKYGNVEMKETKKVGEKRKKADEVADTMVSKEGFDDESKLLRTVFVGNLPLKVKKKLIVKEFSKFGEVESVRIRSVPIVDSKRTRKGAIMLKQINEKASSVHAYVVFETEQSAEASLALNMSLIDGNHIRVDRACPPRKKLKQMESRVNKYIYLPLVPKSRFQKQSMGFKRLTKFTAMIFIFFAMSCLKSISTTQVGTSDRDSDGMFDSDAFCISDQYIMQSYFTTHSSLNDSEFRSFLRLHQCSENIPSEDVPLVAMLQHRDITGEGSHRHLLTSIKIRPFHSQSHLHELVVVERLPLGVFADPFELQSLQQRRAFRDVSVFGDTDLEQPSFRSNRSVVEIHVDINENGGISVKLPLHARYQSIGESGYFRVEFGVPDLFLCSRHEQRRCLVLSIGQSKSETRSVVWEIPAGIRSHTEYVFVVTFVAAVLSALSILVASVLSSKVESCKNTKQP